ncbi:DUF1684 domain-containing protein [Tenacibaculum sp. UWU-22]|uniref:DUF1684 domain-containing protein n=1 Tax=Tenacibaculum sp. UWU-22 TaxID=3234187 RepID=UPI0034DACEAF
MKYLIILFSAYYMLSCNSEEKIAVVGKSDFQKRMNAEFKDATKTPLTKKDFKNFKGLDFYPIDSSYKVVATIVKTPNSPIFEMKTTTDRKPLYKKYGVLYFTLHQKKLQLDVFQSQDIDVDSIYKSYLFLPFTDNTSGTTSYAAGRFIDLRTTDEKEGTIIIDFNKAYNPYCAYNHNYSCPITPESNHLNVDVKAGVMAYKK